VRHPNHEVRKDGDPNDAEEKRDDEAIFLFLSHKT